MDADLPFSAAAQRNREPIREVVARWLVRPARVLEIGSGTGQHAEHLARCLPHLDWQPSERPGELAGLDARVRRAALANLARPVALDVMASEWPLARFDHAFTANTCHIMHWPAVEAMLAGVGQRLPPGGLFLVYGPFHRQGAATSASNARFDAQLRAQDPGMGLRDDAALAAVAAGHGLQWVDEEALPANNRLLVWRRSD